MRPLKIALLASDYWDDGQVNDEEGGSTRQLAEAVAALGHEVIVLSQSHEAFRLKQAKVGALETWIVPRNRHRSLFTGLRDRAGDAAYSHPKVFSKAISLREFLRSRGPFDVLWARSASPDGLIAALAARGGGKVPPTLLQVQDLPFRVDKGAPVFTGQKPIGLAFRHAARILVPAEKVAGLLGHYVPRGLSEAELQAKTRVVPANLLRLFLRAPQEKQYAVPPMRDRVLFLDEINTRRGAPVFLKAVPKTEASKRNSTFVMIGEFSDVSGRFIRRWEEAVEETRKQLFGGRMEYLGPVSPFEIKRQIGLAGVVVLPALYDPFSRGLIEALILGRPVITTDGVGAFSIVQAQQCGIVMPANDPQSLAHAVDIILNALRPFTINAQTIGHRLINEFSPEVIAPQIAQNLFEIAG